MAPFLSEEWFETVLEAAADLPEIDELSFDFDVEVSESAMGKVRAHGRVDRGRLVALAPGKYVSDPPGSAADVSFGAKAKRALPIIEGTVDPLVAYMLGELKIDGAYELVVDRLAASADRAAFAGFRERVAAATG